MVMKPGVQRRIKVRSRPSTAMVSVSSIEMAVRLIVTRAMALRRSATWAAGSLRSAIVHLAFPAMELELPSGWATEFAIDRVKRERRLLIASSICFSISAAGTRASEPASSFRP